MGDRIRNFFIFFFFVSINQNVSKLQIILMFLSYKAEKKKVKKSEKREDDLQRKKKTTEHCDTRTHDVIRRNFEKSSSHGIYLLLPSASTTSYAMNLVSRKIYKKATKATVK